MMTAVSLKIRGITKRSMNALMASVTNQRNKLSQPCDKSEEGRLVKDANWRGFLAGRMCLRLQSTPGKRLLEDVRKAKFSVPALLVADLSGSSQAKISVGSAGTVAEVERFGQGLRRCQYSLDGGGKKPKA